MGYKGEGGIFCKVFLGFRIFFFVGRYCFVFFLEVLFLSLEIDVFILFFAFCFLSIVFILVIVDGCFYRSGSIVVCVFSVVICEF